MDTGEPKAGIGTAAGYSAVRAAEESKVGGRTKSTGGVGRIARRLIVFVLMAYIALVGAMYFAQDWLIYPGQGMKFPPSPQPSGSAELLWLEPEPGVRVPGWLLMPTAGEASGGAGGASLDKKPLVVWLHGNAETADQRAAGRDAAMWRQMGWMVLVPEYRGFGQSGGRAGQAAIVSDALAMVELVLKRPDVDASRVVYLGRSLGGGVAAAMAQRRLPAALILEITFTSIASFATQHLVPAFVCTSPYHTDRVLEKLDIPVLILHGTRDDIVPVSHGRALAKLARRGTYIESDDDHLQFPKDRAWYAGVVAKFVAEVVAPKP